MATSRIKTPLKIAADGGQHDTGDVEFSFVRKSICHDFLLANYGADLSFIGNGNCNGTAVKCQQSIGTHTPPLKKCVAHGSHRKEECCRGARSSSPSKNFAEEDRTERQTGNVFSTVTMFSLFTFRSC
jgi:hypothetical protein